MYVYFLKNDDANIHIYIYMYISIFRKMYFVDKVHFFFYFGAIQFVNTVGSFFLLLLCYFYRKTQLRRPHGVQLFYCIACGDSPHAIQ